MLYPPTPDISKLNVRKINGWQDDTYIKLKHAAYTKSLSKTLSELKGQLGTPLVLNYLSKYI